jgi:hypothetical protein
LYLGVVGEIVASGTLIGNDFLSDFVWWPTTGPPKLELWLWESSGFTAVKCPAFVTR